MKVNIQKFQTGGGFATFTPIVEQESSRSTSKSSQAADTNKSSSILDDETFKELIKGGLVNDVNSLVNDLIKLESGSTYPYVQSQNRSTALRMIAKVNEVKQNYKLWDDAVNKAKESGGYSEVAVDNNQMFTKDKNGKIKAISISDYARSEEKVKVLSVAELMQERQYNPQLANQNSIFGVANNSIGLSKILDQINKVISAFGSEETSETKIYSKDQVLKELGKYTGKKPTAEEAQSIKRLMDIVNTPGELYKVKTTDSSERRQTMKALNYIWHTLGDPAQKKLAATAALNGVSNPAEIILDMISTQTDEKHGFEITPESTKNVDGTSSTSGTSGGSVEATPFELFHNGKLGKQIIPWNDPSSGKTFNLTATGIAKLMTVEGKPIGPNTVSNILKTENGALVNSSKAFFGDKQISINDANKLVYDGELAMRVYAPVASNGGVDYYKLEELIKVEEEVSKNKELTIDQINDIYKEHGFSYVQVDGNKQYVLNDRFKPFLMFRAYGTDEMNVTKDNSKIKSLSSDEQKQISELLKNVWTASKVEAPVGHLWTSYFKGMVAIPYIENATAYSGAIAKTLTLPKVDLETARYEIEKSKGTQLNASSTSLW